MPSMLDRHAKELLTLIKPDGTRHEEIQALVLPDEITIPDASVPLEESDILVRTLPNGLEETYEVLDRGLHQGLGRQPPYYMARVRKTTTPPPRHGATQIVYNLHGAHSRVNIQSVDQSVTVVDTTPERLFEELRDAIESGVEQAAQRTELIKRAAALEESEGSETFVEKYQDFIASAANHMTLIAPFLPALTQLLTK